MADLKRLMAEHPRGRELLVGAAHLTALNGLAFAQPIYDLLHRDPSALVSTDLSGAALLLFVAGVALGPPLVLLCAEAVALAISERLRWILHLCFVGGFVALFGLQAHTTLNLDGSLLTPLSLALGVLGALAYRRSAGLRLGLSVLAPAPLVFAAIFLASPGVGPLLRSSSGEAPAVATTTSAPVVLVVMDEFPVASLLDRQARIDGGRYPAFARLAADGTWFENTTSVDAFTPWAVPAILTGNYPDPDRLPTSSEQPRSIFTLLRNGHAAHVIEPVTRICPAVMCDPEQPGAPARALSAVNQLSSPITYRLLPSGAATRAVRVNRRVQRLLGADTSGYYLASKLEARRADFTRFVASIRAERPPGLYVMHVLLPHSPWEFLPSGLRYQAERRGLSHSRWVGDRVLVDQSWQRHLLQVEYVDRLLGTLVRKLESEGLYDKALIAVTADHGMNFSPNGRPRELDRQSVRQLASVPFIMKAPGQRRGVVSSEPLETVDILPTIADALRVRIPWATDGTSAFSPNRRHPQMARMSERGKGHVTVRRALLAHGGATLARRLALFGSGRDRRPLYTLGAWAELVGRPVRESTLQPDRSARVRLSGPERFQHVDLSAPIVPAEVEGVLEGSTGPTSRDLAIAVNGRIRSVTRSFRSGGVERFAAMLPQAALRAGANHIAVLTVRGRAGSPLLAKLPAARG